MAFYVVLSIQCLIFLVIYLYDTKIIAEAKDVGMESLDTTPLSGNGVSQVKFHPNESVIPSGNNNNKDVDNIVNDLLSHSGHSLNFDVDKSGRKKNFTCIKCCDFVCDETEVCFNAAQCFQARRRDLTGTEFYLRGCIDKAQQIPLMCQSTYAKDDSVEGFAIECCSENICNNDPYPLIPETSGNFNMDGSNFVMSVAVYITLGAVALAVLITFAFWTAISRYLCKVVCRKEREDPSRANLYNPFSSISFSSIYRNNNKLNVDESALRNLNDSASSGSGAGAPLFVHRSPAKNIYLDTIIGKGRYGEVWKGYWQDEPVAVKIFSTVDEASWLRETQIYSLSLIQHDNVVAFYGADKAYRASSLQLWLITCFHERGSLMQFLRSQPLAQSESYAICSSITSGVLHLHTEIVGSQGKPAISHRDLNSNNIIVKSDGTCCLSDFSVAAYRIPGSSELNVGSSDRCGSVRYMSPEMMDGSIDLDAFESFRKMDIYALAIILWEVCNRTECCGVCVPYARPFDHLFSAEPSYDQMKEAVCDNHQRPQIHNRWTDDRSLSAMARTLSECWDANPDVRLTALRIKKNIAKIFQDSKMALDKDVM